MSHSAAQEPPGPANAVRSMSKGRERRRANENAPHHVSAGRRGRCDGDRHRAECFGGTERATLLRRGGIDQLSKTGQRAGLHLASRLASGFPPLQQPEVGVGWDITRGGRRLGITRGGRLLGMTRNTAGFSLDLPFCGLRNLLSLRTFGAPRRRRQHVHPGIPMPRTRVARPHTRRRATRRSPLRSGWRRSRPPSRSTRPWLAPPRTRVA